MTAQPDPLDAALADLAQNFAANSDAPAPNAAAETELDRTLQDLNKQAQSPSTLANSPGSQQTDNFLAELCAEFQQSAPSQAEQALEAHLEADLTALTQQFQSKSPATTPDLDRALTHQMDAHVNTLHEQRHQAWSAQQRRLRLEQRAQAWLAQLDPHSSEGLWFNELATHYPSKLDAAVDYLDSLLTESMPEP
ncbi:MAG: salt stress protein, Slr1339 family [Spirulinaceae cyanobacterium]